MRRIVFAFLVWAIAIATECRAQTLGMPIGRDVYPIMEIDEEILHPSDFPMVTFPNAVWEEARACFIEQLKHQPDASRLIADALRAQKPDLRIVPGAHTIRLRDMTLDSLLAIRDTEYLSRFQNPTPAYALVRENLVLVVSQWSGFTGVLRHEALHSLLWQTGDARFKYANFGHPAWVFQPCDLALSVK
jgi:hypothetical protein